MKWILFILFFLSVDVTYAQVVVEEPVGMDRVLLEYSNLYPKNEVIQGWSILVALNRDRRKIDEIQREFRYRFPSIGEDAEWTFENPYYKLIIGAFEERRDSLPLLEKIRKRYPGAFEVKNSFIRNEVIAFQRRIQL